MIQILFQDFKNHLPSFFSIQMQLIFALILTAYTFSLVIDGYTTVKKIETLSKGKEVYKLCENMEEDQIVELTDRKSEELYEFECYLEKAKGLTLISAVNTQSFSINIEETEVDLSKAKDSFLKCDEEMALAENVMVSENFFDFYGIQGTYDLDDDADGAKHVVLGHSYKGVFAMGDTIYDAYDNVYIVSGFLPEGSYYINPYETNEPYYLDDYFVTKVEKQNGDGIGSLFKILSTFIITDDYQDVDSVIAETRALEIDVFQMENFTVRMDKTITSIQNSVITMGAMALLIMFFCSIGFITVLKQFISEYMEEFAVHMLCGATRQDVIRRMCCLATLPTLVALLVSIIVFGISRELIPTLAVTVLYTAVILLGPICALRRLQITDIMRK